MASGRNVQLTRQIGEHVVVAELGRRNWLASTFTGNVPGFDIVAVDPTGRLIEVQVKALRSGTWQLNAGQFIDVAVKNGVQTIRGLQRVETRGRVMVFVHIHDGRPDDFYLCSIQELQQLLLTSYQAGRRPKNPTTLHHALHPKDIQQFKDNWKALDE